MGRILRALSRATGGVIAALMLLSAPSPAPAAEPLTSAFYGTVVDGPMLRGDTNVAAEMARMRQTGLGFIRLPVHWEIVQPYPGWDAVPANERAAYTDVAGIPTDFRQLDRWMKEAARNGLEVLPAILRTPWYVATNADNRASSIADRGYPQFQALLTALVQRYGSAGSLWRGGGPAARVRDWQVWNEPNVTMFLLADPWAAEYVKILRAASTAIRAADPTARIVLAGLPNRAWEAIEQIYAAGGQGLFDVAAVHPYSQRVTGVVEIVRRSRQVMRRHGDGAKPLFVTEMGWTSGHGLTKQPQFTWDTTEAGQALRLRTAMTSLSKLRGRLGIERVTWYTWLSPARGLVDVFSYAGLRQQTDKGAADKPALRALRTVIRQMTTRGR